MQRSLVMGANYSALKATVLLVIYQNRDCTLVIHGRSIIGTTDREGTHDAETNGRNESTRD